MNDNSSNLTKKKYIYYNGEEYTLEEFIEILLGENKYKFDLDYKDYATSSAGNLFKFNNESKLGNFGNALLDVIPQYNPLNLSNTLVGRGIDYSLSIKGMGNITPLESIGTIMLGKQMTFNMVSYTARGVASNYLPSINWENLFTNQPIFVKPADYTITNLDITRFNWVDNLIIPSFYKMIQHDKNYHNITDSNQIIKYTGKGQLINLFNLLSLNLYKSSSFVDEYGNKYKIKKQKDLINELKKNRFNFLSENSNNPYSLVFSISDITLDKPLSDNEASDKEEYTPNFLYILDNYGITNKQQDIKDAVKFISNYDDEADVQNRLVWGRNGVDSDVKNYLDNSIDKYTKDLINSQTDNIKNFKIKRGLLEYTKNLLNVSSGFYVDMTRKIYRDVNKNIVGFNGSPVWEKERTKYSGKNFKRNEGIRQHNALDKYDRFVKAIRFDGNIAYNKQGGNENSVIYKTVIPKIHPIRDGLNKVDNRNMMFSIENLAVVAVEDNVNGVGFINDESGSEIPLSEVGPFNGRIMWFPPYGIELNESSSAKYDSTVMVGRNEAIYTYMNSERSATLSFVLLIDHPPHLINYMGEEDYKKRIANFFAFGGDDYYEDSVNIGNISKNINHIEKKIKNLENNINHYNNNDVKLPSPISVYFPNDYPKEGGISNIIDFMYNHNYELENDTNSTIVGDCGSTALNENIYVSGSNISQYDVANNNKLNKILRIVYDNDDYKKTIGIKLEGFASKFGNPESNKKLAERRIEAVKYFLLKRLDAIYPSNDFVDDDIFIEFNNYGDEKSTQINDNNNNSEVIKKDRRVDISFIHNGKTISNDNSVSDGNNETEIKKLKKKIDELYTILYRARNRDNKIFKERTKEDKAIFDTFETIKTNHYKPMYHSQTPEDFHRRLTFLQQCTRQGSAVRNKSSKYSAKNSVFGRQPICVLRVGDFFYTKVIIDNVTIDYNDTTWDMNPEGFGMQPMIARITLQMKLIGGQSLSGPIDALQNAVSLNYYANSTFTSKGIYKKPSDVAKIQKEYKDRMLEVVKNEMLKMKC